MRADPAEPRNLGPAAAGPFPRVPARETSSGRPSPRWSRRFLVAIVGALALLAARRLSVGFDHLLFVPAARPSTGFQRAVGEGAVDLVMRHLETRAYFARRGSAVTVYPPAAYVLLWPFVASGTVSAARWAWAVVLAVSLAWICRTIALASGFREPLARLAFGILPLTFLSTTAMLSVGQMTAPILALSVASVLRLARRPATRRDDAVGAGLFALAAVKPSMVAPFGWLLLFVPGSLVPAAIAAGVHGGLTALALVLRHFGAGVVGVASARPEASVVSTGASKVLAGTASVAPGVSSAWDMARMIEGGVANLQNLLLDFGIGAPWVTLAPFLVTAALGPWAWRHRRDDVWILLGVAGLIARFAFYHRVYDDLLVIPGLVALARIASGAIERPGGADAEGSPGVAHAALAILVASAIGLLLPRDFPPSEVRLRLNACAWAAALALLLQVVRPGGVAAAPVAAPESE